MPALPAFDLSRFDLSKVKLPSVDLPKPNLSAIPTPRLPLPNVELPGADRVAGFARDAGYIGVGLVVLGVQQAQVRRRDLVSSMRNSIDNLRDVVA